ncbi:MAG: hypothetical protein AAFP19_17510, partial [Bacteroidota bacterium]
MNTTSLFYLLLALFYQAPSTLPTNSACVGAVDAGPDQAVCTPGESVILNGSIDGIVYEMNWIPAAGLDDPNSLSPTATVFGPAVYELSALIYDPDGPNLIINGDFESGPAGITSDFSFAAPSNPFALANPGTYTVTTSPSIVFSNFPPCDDITFGDGTGNMMIVNGGSGNGERVWCQTVAVTPNTPYTFSAFFGSIHPISPATLEITINGASIGQSNLPGAICAWTSFSEVWNSGPSTTAEICILDIGNNSQFFGNDYVLDEISLIGPCRTSDQVSINVLDPQAIVTNPIVNIPCENQCTTLSVSSNQPGASYQWTASGGGIILSGADSPNPEVCVAGTYSVVATVNNFGISCSSPPSAVSVLVDGFLPLSPQILGADTICGTSNEFYSITNGFPDYTYTWEIDGGTITSGQGTAGVEVAWDGDDLGVICAFAQNTCGLSPLNCFPVFVGALDSMVVDTLLCQGDTLQLEGTPYFESGIYYDTLQNLLGCDTLFRLNLIVLSSDTTEIFLSDCDPNQVGIIQTILTNSNGCDSLVITQTDLLNSDTTEIFLTNCDLNQVGTTQTL